MKVLFLSAADSAILRSKIEQEISQEIEQNSTNSLADIALPTMATLKILGKYIQYAAPVDTRISAFLEKLDQAYSLTNTKVENMSPQKLQETLIKLLRDPFEKNDSLVVVTVSEQDKLNLDALMAPLKIESSTIEFPTLPEEMAGLLSDLGQLIRG